MESEKRHKGGIPHAEEKALPVPGWDWVQSSDQKPCPDEEQTDSAGTLHGLRGWPDSENSFCPGEKNLIHTEPLTWLFRVSGFLLSVHSHLLHLKEWTMHRARFCRALHWLLQILQIRERNVILQIISCRSVTMIPWALEMGFISLLYEESGNHV